MSSGNKNKSIICYNLGILIFHLMIIDFEIMSERDTKLQYDKICWELTNHFDLITVPLSTVIIGYLFKHAFYKSFLVKFCTFLLCISLILSLVNVIPTYHVWQNMRDMGTKYKSNCLHKIALWIWYGSVISYILPIIGLTIFMFLFDNYEK